MPLAGRAESIAALGDREFDLLVIGGGITGCGVARDAALRGLRVALVDKQDFAHGTSSRSSRLIHGGVRYLEHGHLRLVFESSAERRRLLQLAPHLVRPLAFTWPVYAGARIGLAKLVAGLTLYDALSLFRNVGRHKRLSAAAVAATEPGLRRDGLRGGARYYDAATDDARLTLANALGAAAAGAVVVNYAELRGFRSNVTAQQVSGATIRDGLAEHDLDVRARVIVNATGPWSDAVRRLEIAATGHTRPIGDGPERIRASVGAHIAVPRARIGNRAAVTLLSPIDGRVMFILPEGRLCVIGTTERAAETSPDRVRATEGEIRYLLEAANRFFPSAHLTRDDVVSAWAGIRPLINSDDGVELGRASREHAIERGPAGVLSVTGGKLTTYRVMGADVVDEVERMLGRTPRRAPTIEAILPGGDLVSVAAAIAEAQGEVGDSEVAERLVHAYGSEWRTVWHYAATVANGRSRLTPELPYLVGEMAYAVDHELARTLADVLIRRTRIAFETRDHGLAIAPTVANVIAPRLGWDADYCRAELDRLRQDLDAVFAVDEAR